MADPNAKLIISFEWDYIPFTYPQSHPSLPSFVIIGLPVSEASNALVLPVIGHELGHSLWRRGKVDMHFEPEITKTIASAIRTTFSERYNSIYSFIGITADNCDDYNNIWTWSDAAEYAVRQVEELFSDHTGLLRSNIS